MMASPPKNSSEETARLLSPEMISTPPQHERNEPLLLNPERPARGMFHHHTPREPFQEQTPALSLTTVMRVITACLALTSFVIILVVAPHRWYHRNKGYTPSAVFDMFVFVWQCLNVLRNIKISVDLGDRDIQLLGRSRRAGTAGKDKESRLRARRLIALVDLALFIGLLPSWIVMVCDDDHDVGAAAVDALVLFLEAFLVLSQTIPVLRKLVITLKEDDYVYQIGLPTAEVGGSV